MAPSIQEMLLRLALAFLAGVIIGSERETRGRPAGMRTILLVTTASAVAMILTELLLVDSVKSGVAEALRADPARLGAGILTGIGFLGAATVIRHENIVWGVTTAATIWFMAVVGLVIGAGYFILGGAATLFGLAALTVLGFFEDLLPSSRVATLTVASRWGSVSEREFNTSLEKARARVLRIQISQNLETQEKVVSWEVKLNRNDFLETSVRLSNELAAIPGVLRTEWK